MIETAEQAVASLREALRDYIEATYHIGHPSLVRQRRRLLDEGATIAQVPYFESTPRYRTGESFGRMGGLPEAARELFHVLSQPVGDLPKRVFDPPYSHQYQAVQKALVERRSLVVMTGTGSGKTESFLLPILGRLAREAKNSPRTFAGFNAVRCLILYPMNALVNDQLARLRLLVGDPRTVELMKRYGGRPARFARYTSRTLYPGVRTSKRDQSRLRLIEDYYLKLLEGTAEERARAAELRRRGKWPAKADLRAWYGSRGQRWTNHNGDFVRCVLQPDDAELITRHEVQQNPPDVLVTNYSMLEYMMMRPLERPIFDATRDWLRECPDEALMLVIDEAHLYRGAAGAEVGYLIRRLTERLGIEPDRLQVICTSASFASPRAAEEFAGALTGKGKDAFEAVLGDLALREPAGEGSTEEAMALARIDLTSFYQADDDDARRAVVAPWLASRGVESEGQLDRDLYNALDRYPPFNALVNHTMRAAWPIADLERQLFPEAPKEIASKATAVLIALGSLARKAPDEPNLLPCRIHAFFRGLPGLWICLDPDCAELRAEERGGPCGKLYGQPVELCGCGARVLELYTCRHCGTAYARAYADNVVNPQYLWSTPGESFRDVEGLIVEPTPLDVLLERPSNPADVERADLDLVTGRLNPRTLPDRIRTVYLRRERVAPRAARGDGSGLPTAGTDLGEFKPCGVCGQSMRFGRSSVQDHVTKGDQPFQALVARQIAIQPPTATRSDFAPNRGRKVLIFSDSRQVAARLAPNLQDYATQDLTRPLLAAGYARLSRHPAIERRLSLEDGYFALLLGAAALEVVLRPELKPGEGFKAFDMVRRAVKDGALDDEVRLQDLREEVKDEPPPQALLRSIHRAITDNFYGLQALALGFLKERQTDQHRILELPSLGSAVTTADQKLGVVRRWLSAWRRHGIWFSHAPASWHGDEVVLHHGRFDSIKTMLGPDLDKQFKKHWLDQLLRLFCDSVGKDNHRLLASKVSLGLSGEWTYCRTCKTVDTAVPGFAKCSNCGSDSAAPINPNTDPVFVARKGYYRAATVGALADPPRAPMSLIAAEHTAQIGAAQEGDVYSLAEEHELLFQDVDLGADESGRCRPAIDVLSCTTTMEVGVDIGQLAGVALRNMPPGRANYQQRAGRAGRRGSSVATVIALASADSHDNYFFANPDDLVRGQPADPTLALDNLEIARRHALAFLLQEYLADRVTSNTGPAQLFEVLGTVEEFLSSTAPINRSDFAGWLRANEARLQQALGRWLPSELASASRGELLDDLSIWPLTMLDAALAPADPQGEGSE